MEAGKTKFDTTSDYGSRDTSVVDEAIGFIPFKSSIINSKLIPKANLSSY